MNDLILTYALEDRFFRWRIEQLVAERGITTIIETGLDKGFSAVILAGMVENYIGIDIDRAAFEATEQRLVAAGRFHKTHLVLGDSAQYLPIITKTIADAARTIFFLDAHCFGDTDCPILDEIRAIPRGNGIIVFHDIWVPERAAGGFSPLINGNPVRFDYDFLLKELSAWSPVHRIEYLAQYETDLAPGVMFAYPR